MGWFIIIEAANEYNSSRNASVRKPDAPKEKVRLALLKKNLWIKLSNSTSLS
jgi:hypothetical protein